MSPLFHFLHNNPNPTATAHFPSVDGKFRFPVDADYLRSEPLSIFVYDRNDHHPNKLIGTATASVAAMLGRVGEAGGLEIAVELKVRTLHA